MRSMAPMASRTTEHFAKLKAQWEKTKPKSRCQCHACGEREGESQNCSNLHGNHLPSTMFGPFRGLRRPDAKQTIAIAVKYPMRSAVIVISSIPRQFRNDAARTGEKLFPTSQQRLGEKWNYSRPYVAARYADTTLFDPVPMPYL
jgi:hypothetical protein